MPSPWKDAEACIERVARTHRELVAMLEKHRQDFDGEVVATLYLADVARWSTATYQAGRLSDVKAVLDTLDREHQSGDENLREVIDTGFVEALASAGDGPAGLSSLLGPQLQQHYRRFFLGG